MELILALKGAALAVGFTGAIALANRSRPDVVGEAKVSEGLRKLKLKGQPRGRNEQEATAVEFHEDDQPGC